jgi:hypothetical protein
MKDTTNVVKWSKMSPESLDQVIDRINALRAKLHSGSLGEGERAKVAEEMAMWRARLAYHLASRD